MASIFAFRMGLSIPNSLLQSVLGNMKATICDYIFHMLPKITLCRFSDKFGDLCCIPLQTIIHVNKIPHITKIGTTDNLWSLETHVRLNKEVPLVHYS